MHKNFSTHLLPRWEINTYDLSVILSKAQAQDSAPGGRLAKPAFWLLAVAPELQSAFSTCHGFTQVLSQHGVVSRLPTWHLLPSHPGQHWNFLPQPKSQQRFCDIFSYKRTPSVSSKSYFKHAPCTLNPVCLRTENLCDLGTGFDFRHQLSLVPRWHPFSKGEGMQTLGPIGGSLFNAIRRPQGTRTRGSLPGK